MIRLLLLSIVLVSGLVIGALLSDQQGYVLISIADSTIEMSVTTLILFSGIFIAGLFLLEMLVKRLFSAKGWFSARHLRKARYNTFKGMIKLQEGEWKQAEQLLIRGGRNNDFPLINYLSAAKAAQELGKIELRESYLEKAKALSDNQLAISLTRAELQLNEKKYDLALQTLKKVKSENPKNPILLKLLQECYLALNNWNELKNVIYSLKKAHLISAQKAVNLEIQAESGMIKEIAKNKGVAGLLEYWQNLPRKIKQHLPILITLAKQFRNRKADKEAYIVIRDALKSTCDIRLLQLLPSLHLHDYQPAIDLLKEIEKKETDNPALKSTLAQLYMRIEDWALARKYFEASLKIRDDMSDYAYLARVLEKQNRKQAAAAISRKALTTIDVLNDD